MQQIAPEVKVYQIAPAKAYTATASSTGLSVVPGESPSFDACAVINVGAATGTPTSYTAAIVIEESATVGGTYTTNKTVGTATNTGGAQSVHVPVTINPAKPFLRVTATIAFVGGTSPALPIGVDLLVSQQVASDGNVVAIA